VQRYEFLSKSPNLLHPKEGKSPENLELSDILLKFAAKMILLKK
jgi:hypothetical protein